MTNALVLLGDTPARFDFQRFNFGNEKWCWKGDGCEAVGRAVAGGSEGEAAGCTGVRSARIACKGVPWINNVQRVHYSALYTS